MCQSHRAAACTDHATSGNVMNCHVRAKGRVLAKSPRATRQRCGNAQRKVANGLDVTSKGAATSISNSCCVMWALKSAEPSLCNGETWLTKRANHPRANVTACRREVAAPRELLSPKT